MGTFPTPEPGTGETKNAKCQASSLSAPYSHTDTNAPFGNATKGRPLKALSSAPRSLEALVFLRNPPKAISAGANVWEIRDAHALKWRIQTTYFGIIIKEISFSSLRGSLSCLDVRSTFRAFNSVRSVIDRNLERGFGFTAVIN